MQLREGIGDWQAQGERDQIGDARADGVLKAARGEHRAQARERNPKNVAAAYFG